MNHPITFGDLWKQIRRLLIFWLVMAIIAAAVVTGLHYRVLPARFQASAQLHFQFEGMEEGLDPNGNRFDIRVLREKSVIQRAAEKAGIPLKDEAAERIGQALLIESSVPSNMAGRMTKTSSYLTGTEAVEGKTEQNPVFIPTKYTVTLRYGDLGYDTEQGNALFQGLLDAWEEDFRIRYGTNTTLAAVLAEDFPAGMDDEDAASALDVRLGMLSRYIARLSEEDQQGFRSMETGASFQELQARVNALKERDLPALSRFISASGATADSVLRDQKLRYETEKTERLTQMLKGRLENLNRLIDNYQKITEIVVGAAGTLSEAKAAQGELPFTTERVEIRQRSATYEALLNLRMRLRSELAEAQAAAKIINQKEEYEETDAIRTEAGNELARIKKEMQDIASQVWQMEQEFDTDVDLNQAFRVKSVTKGENLPFRRLINTAAPDIIAAEAVLFGILILLSTLLAGIAGRRRRTA